MIVIWAVGGSGLLATHQVFVNARKVDYAEARGNQHPPKIYISIGFKKIHLIETYQAWWLAELLGERLVAAGGERLRGVCADERVRGCAVSIQTRGGQ